MELNAFLETENGNCTVTQSVNQVTQWASNETLEKILHWLSQSLQKSHLQSNQVQTGYKSNKNMKR